MKKLIALVMLASVVMTQACEQAVRVVNHSQFTQFNYLTKDGDGNLVESGMIAVPVGGSVLQPVGSDIYEFYLWPVEQTPPPIAEVWVCFGDFPCSTVRVGFHSLGSYTLEAE